MDKLQSHCVYIRWENYELLLSRNLWMWHTRNNNKSNNNRQQYDVATAAMVSVVTDHTTVWPIFQYSNKKNETKECLLLYILNVLYNYIHKIYMDRLCDAVGYLFYLLFSHERYKLSLKMVSPQKKHTRQRTVLIRTMFRFKWNVIAVRKNNSHKKDLT